ncbi:potassium channel family protein [Corynebacterium glyciniphilum]|uniref:potassium channel family protein n=1 Tax=Corynebacterium glyciniphilum TaxID=1404244 RepID=UPI003DA1B85D
MVKSLRRVRGRIDIPPVVVLGLGRFGASLAEELTCHGVEVLGMDSDARLVQECTGFLTDAAVGDTTDRETLVQFGVHEVDRVVLGIGSDLESSVLTASNLVDLEVPRIWAKADSDAHAKILTQVGVHHVVRPERDTGRRVAHLLGGRFKDFAQFDEDYGMIKLSPPNALIGRKIDLDEVWARYRVRMVSVRRGDTEWQPLQSDMVLSRDDQIIVAGAPEKLEAFATR